MATSARRPTPRQLSYLKSLAERTGQTFTYPATSGDASREIARLTNTRPSTRTERRIERQLIADEIAAGPADAARVRDDEISGHGSSATWLQNRPQDPPPVPDPGARTSRATSRRSASGRSWRATQWPRASGSSTASGSQGSCGSPTGPPHPAGARTSSSEASRAKPSSTLSSLTISHAEVGIGGTMPTP